MGAKTNNVAIFLMIIIKNSWIDWSITRAVFICIDIKFIGITTFNSVLLSSSLTMLLNNSVKGSNKSFTQYLQFVNLFSNCFLDIELSGYVTLCLEIRFYNCQYSKSYIYECNIIMRL